MNIPRKAKKCVCCGKVGFIWSHGHLRECWMKKTAKRIPARSKKRIENHGTGEYDVFMEIANERPHVCFVTRRAVNVWVWEEIDGIWEKKVNVNVMAHVCGKGAHPDLRTLKENIVIVEPEVHTIYDRGNEQERKEMEKYEGWHKLLALHDEILSKNATDNTVRA